MKFMWRHCDCLLVLLRDTHPCTCIASAVYNTYIHSWNTRWELSLSCLPFFQTLSDSAFLGGIQEVPAFRRCQPELWARHIFNTLRLEKWLTFCRRHFKCFLKRRLTKMSSYWRKCMSWAHSSDPTWVSSFTSLVLCEGSNQGAVLV